jgi:hypothetical protein
VPPAVWEEADREEEAVVEESEEVEGENAAADLGAALVAEDLAVAEEEVLEALRAADQVVVADLAAVQEAASAVVPAKAKALADLAEAISIVAARAQADSAAVALIAVDRAERLAASSVADKAARRRGLVATN